mgnify:CR=1 FL=1
MKELFDVHCHMVPGVDDGAADLEESLAMLKMQHEDGVRKIIITPHYRRRMFETPAKKVHEQFLKLQEAAKKEYPDMSLYLGCELHSNMDLQDILEKRKYVIGLVAIVIVLIYVCRLFNLQIMTDDYKKNADSNAFLNRVQFPSRGAIYDRNGELLVFNQPAYDVIYVPREVEPFDTLDFCRTLNITREQFDKRLEDVQNRRLNPGYSRYTQQTFLSQLSAEECGVFQEKLYKFPGFSIQRRTIRQYSYNAAAHALGDIGEVSRREMEKDDYYNRGDYIGKQGIEKSYEKYLRGEKGVEVLLRDAHGRIQGRYMNGQMDRPSVPGKNLTLGLDIELQMLGERLMQNKIGSIVAIEPSTGEILCMVSSPTYDPHLMIGRQRGKNHSMLQADKQKPLLNRAIMGTYPPGSTFKTAQALTFLQEGIVQEETPSFPCSHGFIHRGLRVGCHGHASPLPLVPAIATSCNAYFCWGLYRMFGDKKYGSPQKAITVWKDHMVQQGFGYRLNTDLPGEQRGLIPNAQFYEGLSGFVERLDGYQYCHWTR